MTAVLPAATSTREPADTEAATLEKSSPPAVEEGAVKGALARRGAE